VGSPAWGPQVERHTHARQAAVKAHETPELDPALGLLLAMVLVLLALVLGTGLFLLLPAAL
jgi:hypothetical protein